MPGRVVALVSGKGGVGKSTLALALADVWRSVLEPEAVALLDFPSGEPGIHGGGAAEGHRLRCGTYTQRQPRSPVQFGCGSSGASLRAKDFPFIFPQAQQ